MAKYEGQTSLPSWIREAWIREAAVVVCVILIFNLIIVIPTVAVDPIMRGETGRLLSRSVAAAIKAISQTKLGFAMTFLLSVTASVLTVLYAARRGGTPMRATFKREWPTVIVVAILSFAVYTPVFVWHIISAVHNDHQYFKGQNRHLREQIDHFKRAAQSAAEDTLKTQQILDREIQIAEAFNSYRTALNGLPPTKCYVKITAPRQNADVAVRQSVLRRYNK